MVVWDFFRAGPYQDNTRDRIGISKIEPSKSAIDSDCFISKIHFYYLF